MAESRLDLFDDCLWPLVHGLRRIVGDCWNATDPYSPRPGDSELSDHFRISSFHRDPRAALESFYKECHLDTALPLLAIHDFGSVSREIERRLKEPLKKLSDLQYRACQIHEGSNGQSVLSRPYAIYQLGNKLVADENGEAGPPEIVQLLDMFDGLAWELRDAQLYLESAMQSIESKERSKSAPDAPARWSKIDSPTSWARILGMSYSTFQRRIKGGTIRHKKHSDRLYQVHLDDLPETYKEQVKSKAK